MSLRLWQGYGIELEYMIVDAATLDVKPISDQLLAATAGEITSEVERGPLCWSNELVLHVIELKTNGPAAAIDAPLSAAFQQGIREVDALLAPLGARLMPTAMHPWMDPARETRLWPHDYSAVYACFDAIFGCQGHGWSNLQSMHINLPFQGDEELGRLHAAIRLVMPLLPALAASSPFVEGRPSGWLDSRLEFYRHNCRRLPEVTGRVIPEPVSTAADYRRHILDPIGRAVAPFDPEGILDPEWVNARGAIVRFVRDSIEIRLLDIQEHPGADLAIAALVVAVVRAVAEGRWQPVSAQSAIPTEALEQLLLSCIAQAEQTRLTDPRMRGVFGDGPEATAGELWQRLAEELGTMATCHAGALRVLWKQGPLSRRILRAHTQGRSTREIYEALCDCLEKGNMFLV